MPAPHECQCALARRASARARIAGATSRARTAPGSPPGYSLCARCAGRPDPDGSLGGAQNRQPRRAAARNPPRPRGRINVAAIANGHLFGAAQADARRRGDGRGQCAANQACRWSCRDHRRRRPEDWLRHPGRKRSSAKVYAVGDIRPRRRQAAFGVWRSGAARSQRQTGVADPATSVRAGVGGAVARGRTARRKPRSWTGCGSSSLSNRGLIADIMRPQPVFAQGKQRGYRVYPGRNRQAFTRLGLRPGDLVTAINGTPLDDPARGQEIFQTLGSSSEAHVTVMRNGQQQDLTLNIAQVAQEAEADGRRAGSGTPTPMHRRHAAAGGPTRDIAVATVRGLGEISVNSCSFCWPLCATGRCAALASLATQQLGQRITPELQGRGYHADRRGRQRRPPARTSSSTRACARR